MADELGRQASAGTFPPRDSTAQRRRAEADARNYNQLRPGQWHPVGPVEREALSRMYVVQRFDGSWTTRIVPDKTRAAVAQRKATARRLREQEAARAEARARERAEWRSQPVWARAIERTQTIGGGLLVIGGKGLGILLVLVGSVGLLSGTPQSYAVLVDPTVGAACVFALGLLLFWLGSIRDDD